MAGSADYPRSHRVADFIQRELSSMIRAELRDPRVSPMLTVSAVDVSRDLSVATVHYSVLDPAEREDTDAALKRAAGFLRRRLAQEMQIRSVPELRFRYDDSAERGAAMSALIDRAVASNTTEADDVGGEGASADGAPSEEPCSGVVDEPPGETLDGVPADAPPGLFGPATTPDGGSSGDREPG